MPMHDWKRVKAGIYHMFHGAWLYAIARALNNGVLPPQYYALAEQVTAGVAPDVVTFETPIKKSERPPKLTPGNGVHALPDEQPAVGLVDRKRLVFPTRPRRRLAVRHVSTHNVVAVIEVVSPANKQKKNLGQFVQKAVAVLTVGVHLLVIDPFPPSRRDPAGVHGAIWAALGKPRKGQTPYTQPADRPLTAASYSADSEVVAAVQAFAAGDPVPGMPLFLEPELYVTVPLEDTYQAAWQEMPKVWRDVLEV